MKNVFFILFSVFFLSSCTTHRLTNVERESLYHNYLTEINAESLNRITAFKFYGWRELGDRHLILSTSPKKKYFITLTAPCLDLRFATTIGINRMDSSLNTKFDSIFVPSYPELRCHIKTIHKITREQADKIDDLEKDLLEKKAKADVSGYNK